MATQPFRESTIVSTAGELSSKFISAQARHAASRRWIGYAFSLRSNQKVVEKADKTGSLPTSQRSRPLGFAAT